MPEIPKQHTGEHGFSTLELRQELDNQVASLYPLLTDDVDLAKLSLSGEGDISFGSFVWPGEMTPFAGQVITRALELASRDPNLSSYCDHAAAGHPGSFNEAVNIMEYLISHQNPQALVSEISVGSKHLGSTKQDTYRLVLTGRDWMEREYLRPAPMVAAFNLFNRIKSSSNKPEQIRKEVIKISKTNGVPFGIMVATYSGMKTNEILDLYDNPDIKKQFDTLNLSIPKKSRRSDIPLLNKLHEELMYKDGEPYFEWQKYRTATSMLRTSQWTNLPGVDLDQFINFTQHQKPLFVFLGVPEVAIEIANPEFRDPEKSKYIFVKHANRITTRLITSYLLFQENVPVYHMTR